MMPETIKTAEQPDPQPGQWWQDTRGMFSYQPYRILSVDGEDLVIDYFPGAPYYNTRNQEVKMRSLRLTKAEYVGESEPNPWHAWFGWMGLTYPYRIAKPHGNNVR